MAGTTACGVRIFPIITMRKSPLKIIEDAEKIEFKGDFARGLIIYTEAEFEKQSLYKVKVKKNKYRLCLNPNLISISRRGIHTT